MGYAILPKILYTFALKINTYRMKRTAIEKLYAWKNKEGRKIHLHFITIGRPIHYQVLGVPFLFPLDSTKQIIHHHLLLNNPTMLAIRNAVCSDHCQMYGLLGSQGTL